MKSLKILTICIMSLIFGSQESNAQSNPNNAYGDNQKEVEPGVFAIYSGDVTQDGFLGFDDVDAIDQDNIAGLFGGYFVTDLTGDGFLGFDDVDLADQNNILGVFVQKP